MAGYIKIGDIKGECIDAGHKEWINLLSISQSITRPMKAGYAGSTRQKASADVGDVVCVKEFDSSSVKLIEACADGKVFPEVEFHMATSIGGGKRETFYEVKMYNVHVVNYDTSGSCTDGAIPHESFSLNFEKIEWTYKKRDAAGGDKGKVGASWKVGEGTT